MKHKVVMSKLKYRKCVNKISSTVYEGVCIYFSFAQLTRGEEGKKESMLIQLNIRFPFRSQYVSQ